MISAELKHRDYVDYYTIACQFSRLEFYGNENVVQTLKEISELVQNSQSRKNKVKINCLKESYNENKQKIAQLE